MSYQHKDLVNKTSDIVNWRIQAEEWKRQNKNKDDIANKVMGYVFLKNQDFNWKRDHGLNQDVDSITATQNYFSPKKQLKGSLFKEKLTQPQLFESSLNLSSNVNVQDPFQFFDYPVPDELMGFLNKQTKSVPTVKEFHKLKKRAICCTSPVLKRTAKEKFKQIYSTIQKYKTMKLQNRSTQTEFFMPYKFDSSSRQPSRHNRFQKPTEVEKPVLQTHQFPHAHTSSDIDVVVDNRIFRSHKVMLIAFSQWFHKTLTHLPHNTSRVVLDGIDADSFDVIYQWMYTYKLNVTVENISSVMTVAKRLEMPFLLKKLRNTVLKIIVVMGPIAVFNFAEKMGNTQLKTYVTYTLNERIAALAQSHVFLHYTVDELCALFSPEYSVHPKPTETCYLLVLWFAHNWSNRKIHVPRVLEIIPVNALTNDEMLQCVRIIKDYNINKNEDCRETILRCFMNSVDKQCKCRRIRDVTPTSTDNFFSQLKTLILEEEPKYELDPKLLKEVVAIQQQFEPTECGVEKIEEPEEPCQLARESSSATNIRSVFRGHRTHRVLSRTKISDECCDDSSRAPNHSYFLLIGGIDPFRETTKDDTMGSAIFCYSVDENRWGIIDHLPAPRHHAGAALLHSAIYITGGSGLFNGDYFEATNCVWCFEYLLGRWSTKNPMVNCRVYHALVAVDGLLYAIGGMDNQHQLLKSIEFYDPASEMWCVIANMENARMAMSTAVYHKMIVICGGVGEDSSTTISLLLSSCELFVPQSRKILKMKNLRIPRCFASLLQIEGKLHLIGGASVDEERGEVCVFSIKDIDVWDETTKSWLKRNELRSHRQDGVAICFDSRMYVMGGQSSQMNSTILTVECYNHYDNKWFHGTAALPVGVSGACCVLLDSVPRLMMKELKPNLKW